MTAAPIQSAWRRHGHECEADWLHWLETIRDDAVAEFNEEKAFLTHIELQMEILVSTERLSSVRHRLADWVMDERIAEIDGQLSVCFRTAREPTEKVFGDVHELALEIERMDGASFEHWLYFLEDEFD